MYQGREKRKTQPPNVLTYIGLGQQSEVRMSGNQSHSPIVTPAPQPVMEPVGNLYRRKSPAKIENLIAKSKQLIQLAENILVKSEDVATQFKDVDESAVSPDAWQNWIGVLRDRNNAHAIIRINQSEIRELEEALRYVTSKQVTSQEGAHFPPAGSPVGSRSQVATCSNASQKSKKVGIEEEDELIKLETEHNRSLIKLNVKLADIQEAIADATDDERKTLEKGAAALQKQITRKIRDFEFERDTIKRMANLERKKNQIEVEEEQDLCAFPDDQREDEVDRWADHHFSRANDREENNVPQVHFDSKVTEQDVCLPPHQKESIPFPPDFCKVPPPALQSRYFYEPPHRRQDPVADLAKTMKDVLLQVKGGKEWEPKDLPTFNGNPEDWPIFANEFDRTTPSGQINSSQNAIRLRRALKGAAREAVVGLLNDPGNITEIMETLQLSFGRPELVIKALITKAEECKAPEAMKPASFIPFARNVVHLVECVRSLKEDRYLNDVTLLENLVTKLPFNYLREWMRYLATYPTQPKNLMTFAVWLKMEMQIVVPMVTPSITKEAEVKRGAPRGSANIHSTTAVDNSSSQEEGSLCPCCEKGKHKIKNCFKFKRLNVDARSDLVKKIGACFLCIELGHLIRECPSDKLCGKDECQGKHHFLLHAEKRQWKSKGPNRSSGESNPSRKEKENLEDDLNIGAIQSKSSKPLSIVKVKVRGDKGTRKVYALLDSGADTTIIESDLATELGLRGKPVLTSCRGVGGTKIPVKGQEVSFEVAGVFRAAKFYGISGAITMANLGLAPYSQSVSNAKSRWPYMRKAKLETFDSVVPKLIIGEDHPFVTAHREILERGEGDPIAKRTLLGWVIAGKNVGSNKGDHHINVLSMDDGQRLDQLIQRSFSLDSFGVYPQNTEGSVEDRKALKILEETVQKTGSAWECGLLWRDPNVTLPDSKPEAISRMLSNERRMKKDAVFFTMYHEKMDEYLQKGYISELSAEEERSVNNKTMYIPHFGVFNVNKPGKLRLVFDAACRNGGVSLNQHLLTGPDLIRPLPAVLINFRIHNIAINGDIEDMFHRVSMRKEDRDSQRFVWRDLRVPPEEQQIKSFTMNVLIFGACSSPSTAIYVKNRNAADFQQQYPEAVKLIDIAFYIDDFLGGAQTVEEAVELRRRICLINNAGNFYVKKWLSNSKEVLSTIPEDERAKGVKGFGDQTEIPTERVLGMQWSAEVDYFTFSTNFKKLDPTLMDGRRPTKREMCSLLMSVFDPLGFLADFKIKGLVLLQRTWKTGVNWDDEIPDCIYEDWKDWVNYLKETEKVKVPRLYCFNIHLASSIQLHTLVDASAEACSAISYLRIKIGDAVQVAFVVAKTKVAPTKKLTIPRLELVAAVMGACLADSTIEHINLPISGRTFWSDSKTVLAWIRSETLRYKEFVANRVNKIHLLSNPAEWKWIPTAVNVADLGTRVNSKIHFAPNSLWLTGPEFLRSESDKWPKEMEHLSYCESDDARSEEKKITVAAIQLKDQLSLPAVVVDMGKFSDFVRMTRAQAAILKAAQHWINKWKGVKVDQPPWSLKGEVQFPRRRNGENSLCLMHSVHRIIRGKLSSFISPEDLEAAEEMLVRQVQQESFGPDIAALQSGKLSRKSKIWKLSPFLENGVLKLHGRIENAKAAENVKYPVIIPSLHHFTELLIMKEHERVGHQGHNTVLSNLRNKYWVIEGRAAIRRVVQKCQSCRMGKAKPIIPRMGVLPHFRLSAGQLPFTFTGVNLFGPLQVVVGRHHEKRWVSVFTCMVTRAIHLEVVYGLTTDETMMALSRFVDQRGRPHHLYSDNGTNFVGANRELNKGWAEVDWRKIMEADKFQQIRWHFNPPAWERMVQAVKKVLKKTLTETFPKDQTLLTMLKGAENIINSRPLTYLSDDPADPQPLTPNHFLRGFCDIGPSIPGEFEPSDEVLRAQWRRAQYFLDKFWIQWNREVLPELLRRDKWHSDAEPLEAGDVVLLVDDQLPRNEWKRAVVKVATPGKDGQVRVVEVEVETSDFATKKKASFRRGVDKVIPLGLKIGKSGNGPDFGGRNVVVP